MTIVVAYSPDEYGRAALRAGADEARVRDEDLVLLNATRGDALVDPRFASDEHIVEVQDALQEQGLTAHVRHEVVPDIAAALVDVAREVGASRVVVGVRHRSPVGKALLGSVAQRVILDAPCAVLAVKP
ncbi:universal stress protein [Aeromicrobium camelliae]|uniref:Universal stress protein n=1 Tax=Aeromicrobium camelliae TaxID=1538144 RepID=A0A3N6WJ32_9ACTN|nr:universal stress protein [Aeromicrobium camelliae]RQN07576.1 universal stress protein [Aeromicrobium camelliae]